MSGTRYSESTLDQYIRMVGAVAACRAPGARGMAAHLTSETQHTACRNFSATRGSRRRSATPALRTRECGKAVTLLGVRPTGQPVPRLLARPRIGIADRVGSTRDVTRHDDPAV
jgi:hypothetical protein